MYFGVDGAWSTAYELTNIMAYFREINPRMAGSGYRVGVYGSGLVCNMLLANGLAELCWLAAPTSWPDFSAYYQSKRWRWRNFRRRNAAAAASISISQTGSKRNTANSGNRILQGHCAKANRRHARQALLISASAATPDAAMSLVVPAAVDEQLSCNCRFIALSAFARLYSAAPFDSLLSLSRDRII